MAALTTEDLKILETIREALPDMSEAQKSYLMGFGEGVIAIRAKKKDPDPEEKQPA